ncbi:MAG TPA: adenylate/guanylate cyclase domain-containing protein [Terriglobales bacterium]|nr:adenylate/guanylate cyclase domain-containing protein [Terriglobales bacterium]
MGDSTKSKPKGVPKLVTRDYAALLSAFENPFLKVLEKHDQQYRDLFKNFSDSYFLAPNYAPALVGEIATQKARQLNEEISNLRKDIESKTDELAREKKGAAETKSAIAALQKQFDELREKERVSFLLSRVNPEAQTKLLTSPEFQKKFLDGSECETFVMSVDIRRSTELMLKAKNPQEFARFITTVCRDLETVIMESYGVVDKFTGDGVLAFFPDFFSGQDAGFYAALAAQQCHRAFAKRYKEMRSSFTTVLADAGLGIGIDFGKTHLFQLAGGLTVVGAPVVYACRMSAARAGTTLLNQQGFEQLSAKFSEYCFFEETELEVKHEGRTIAYEVRLNGKSFVPRAPDWLERRPNPA